MNISEIKRIKFRNDINGLRAISVLAVIFYHAELKIFTGGWLGVDIFFVISGYLISNIIISELNSEKFSFKQFFLRRIKRIFPALFFMLIATIPFSYFFLSPKAMLEYLGSFLSSIFFYSNYYFDNLIFYNSEPTALMPLLHTWSLAIEEQFYLIFPFFAFVLFKYFKKYFFQIISLVTIFSLFINSLTQDFSKFYLLQYRVWELLLGVILMILNFNYSIKRLEKFGFLLMLFPMIYFDSSSVNQIEPKLISLMGTSLIILSNTEESTLSKLLNIKLFKLIGLSSYSAYLLHQPMFAFYRINKSKDLIVLEEVEKILLILTLLVISYFSWKFIEIKFQKLKFSLNFKILFCFTTIFILSFVYLGTINKGYPDRYVKVNNLALNSDFQIEKLYLINENGKICGGFENYCEYINESNKKIILIGDSQGQTLQKYIYERVKSSHSFINLSSDIFFRCVFYIEDPVGDCKGDEKNKFEEFLNKNQNSTFIFFSSYQRYEPNWLKSEENFSKVFKDIINNNNDLIILSPVPFVYEKKDIKNLYFDEDFIYLETIGYSLNEWESHRNKIISFLSNKNFSLLLDPSDIFCNRFIEKYCIQAFGDKIYYYDSIHLSHEGVKLLTSYLFDEIDKNLSILRNY